MAYRSTSHMLKTGIVNVLVVVLAICMLWPFIWMFSSSLKTNDELAKGLISLVPKKVQWRNYVEAMRLADFPRFYLNSAVVSVIRTGLTLLLCSTAGYAFARLKFRGNKVLFMAILACYMIPFQAILVPLFLIVKNMPLLGGNNILGQGGTGALNSFLGLILPTMPLAYGTFLLRQFFGTLPTELDDAARIDGCTDFGIYYRIILPLAGPALATLAIFTFQWSWNDFLWPLVATRSESMKTVQIGLAFFQMQFRTNWAYLMAAATTSTIPVVCMFVALQKYFLEGIQVTGLKG